MAGEVIRREPSTLRRDMVNHFLGHRAFIKQCACSFCSALLICIDQPLQRRRQPGLRKTFSMLDWSTIGEPDRCILRIGEIVPFVDGCCRDQILMRRKAKFGEGLSGSSEFRESLGPKTFDGREAGVGQSGGHGS